MGFHTLSLFPALLVCGLLHPARAQYTQQGGKLAGGGAVGSPVYQGSGVGLSGDGNTAIIGGPGDDGNTGATWIFTRTNGAWSQQGSKLVASDAVGPAKQGGSVSISRDGNTVLIGGVGDNGNTGAAWVFTRKNGIWSQQGSKLVAGDAVVGVGYGFSVALSGDGATVIVGGLSTGGASIFTRTNGAWSQQGSKLTTGSVLDAAVALSGDGNTAVLGGPSARATVFTRSNGIWNPQAGLVAQDAAGGGGAPAVSISDDGNTVAIGGWDDNTQKGATWIFTRASSPINGGWSQQGSKLVGAGAVLNAQQGTAVAISANGNILTVGGLADNHGAGAVWIFARTNGPWNQVGSKLTGSGAQGVAAEQGAAVATSADGSTVIGGGPLDGNNLMGAAWVFVAPATATPTGVVPSGGKGTVGTFTFTFSDTSGWQNLTVLNVLFNSVVDGRQSCYVAFVPSGASSGSVYLVDDIGDAGGPYSGIVLPGNGVAQNSQCTISAAGSWVLGSGNTVTLVLAIAFSPAFYGNQVTYLAARDASSNSGWQALGTWNVPGTVTVGPGVSGLDPARSTTLNQTFTVTFADTNGWQDISIVNVLINNAISGIGACYVACVPFSANSGSLFLVDDAGDAAGPYLGTLVPTPPGVAPVSNSQCSIGATSSVTASGNTLTLTLPITFSQTFAGNQVVYVAARSKTQNSGWQAVGSATVPPQ